MISLSIARLILYVKNIAEVAAFYQRFFDLTPMPGATDGWLELRCPSGTCTLALHQAAKSQKSGAAMKLVFGVPDVQAFVQSREKLGLAFGTIRRVEGFEFANAKDPAGNSISVSSRGF